MKKARCQECGRYLTWKNIDHDNFLFKLFLNLMDFYYCKSCKIKLEKKEQFYLDKQYKKTYGIKFKR